MEPETLRIKSISALSVYKEIALRIAQGQYPAGAWLPPERVLAEEFGIDRPVVRNALAHLAKEGIIVTQRGKRPWVNGARTPLSTFSSSNATSARKIAAIMPQSPHYPAASAIMHGVNRTARILPTPPQIVMFDTSGTAMVDGNLHESRALRTVLDEAYDAALLWWHGGAETMPLILQCHERGIPIVFVDRFPEDFSCDFVGVDNETGVDQAMEYLCSLGHRRIAHLTTYEDATTVHHRREEFISFLRNEGVQAPADWTYLLSDTSGESIREAVGKWMSMEEPPTAVFTLNDHLAHLLIVELDQMNIRVPEVLSIVGFDDLEQFSPRPALLTSIHQPFDRIGKRAMKVLANRVEASARHSTAQHILLPPSLVVRTTCRSIVS